MQLSPNHPPPTPANPPTPTPAMSKWNILWLVESVGSNL